MRRGRPYNPMSPIWRTLISTVVVIAVIVVIVVVLV